MEFELVLEGETRCDEKLTARIRGQLGGRSWKGYESSQAVENYREDWEGQPGSVAEGSESQAEELDSVLPMALTVGNYWKLVAE